MNWSDLSAEDYHLHPGLKRYVSALKTIRLALAIIIIIVTVVGLYYAYLFAKGAPYAVKLALAAVPVLMPFFYLYYIIPKKYFPKVVRAARVIQIEPPQILHMGFLGFGDLRGAYVELRRTGAYQDNSLWGIAAIGASRLKTQASQPALVKVHLEPNSADNYLVIDAEQKIYWGCLTTARDRADSWRQYRRTMFFLMAQLIIVLTLLIVVQARDYLEARRNLASSYASQTWPNAPGIITLSRLREVDITRFKWSVPGYRAEIQYLYAAAGRSYQGELIHFWYQPTEEKPEAAKYVKKYRQGMLVQVVYDPDAPERAVLEPGHTEEGLQQLRHLTYTSLTTSGGSLLCLAILVGLLQRNSRNRARWARAYQAWAGLA